jgi:hypothetical protein
MGQICYNHKNDDPAALHPFQKNPQTDGDYHRRFVVDDDGDGFEYEVRMVFSKLSFFKQPA